ncbi:hypothetical protein THAOC_20514 [Thalassiosira oceanica]|uniref:Uncharacterized protein n=1 Tax=Thalassiosira oceanica TaxID=159749 RepID=K0SEC4_THAOC|nr:hypothetical protein THAOC_20514 [Thalassiosira oceanica]|eukprot:EJK59286.1 hypothetical protein THAOC_20514 [Thalassiosira oceanica]
MERTQSGSTQVQKKGHHTPESCPFILLDELQWEAEDESVKEIEITDADEMPKEIEITDADETPTEIEIIDADESLQEIEVDDGLPSLSSPFSLRTNTKPTNDDALCDDPSSTSLVDRVSEGDERVVEQTYTTAYTADCSLLPTSTSMMAHDSDPEGDGNFFSSDSDGVYVPEGEVYYTMNGDRLADDDSQLPFGLSRPMGA